MVISKGTKTRHAVPSSWIETGVGGHTSLETESGELNGFTALHGLPGGIDEDPNTPYAAQITEFGEGLYNSFSSTPGQKYFVDFVFGVFAPDSVAEIEIFIYDGLDTTGLLLDNFTFIADPVAFGGGNATGSYAFEVNAAGDTTALLFTLDNSLGVGEDNFYLDSVQVRAVPEPCSVAFTLSALVTFLAVTRRRTTCRC